MTDRSHIRLTGLVLLLGARASCPHLGGRRALAAIVIVGALVFILGCGTETRAPAKPVDPDLEPAADFELVLFENRDHSAGETIKLSQFAGQPVVLNFWFPSCAPCVAEMPEFEAAYQQYKGEGVQFVGVQLLGLDTAEDGQKFVNKLGVNYVVGPDRQSEGTGAILMDYEVAGFPTTVFINRDQKINRTWTGPLNLEKLEELIAEIL